MWMILSSRTRNMRSAHAERAADCQKAGQAESYGGKKSVKGNRQGVLSRSITRRSGRIAKYYYKVLFCNSECSLAKKPEGTFLTS